jgi:cell wall-active antibiotic response 4TMS protein YvqF/B-box zinc finger protein
MNCLNHPDVAAAAYCQNCGKPLCTACIRSVGGVVYCEPCLAARLSAQPGAAEANLTGLHAHPVLAGLLGFIPGVGAMYNGQFVKALAHVLIFAVFVSLADKSFVFGLLIAAWVFYQVFDAAQTAKARRDGLPLPNPFGLNDLGNKLGIAPPAAPYAAGFAPPPPPGAGAPGTNPNPGPYAGQSPNPADPFQQPPAYTSSYAVPPQGPAGAPAPGFTPYSEPLAVEPRHRHPFGAVVLIVIGLVLLLHTLGIFEDEWIGRAWPIILIGIGAWLLYRRTQDVPRGGAR